MCFLKLFCCLSFDIQVPGSMLKQMPSPGGSVLGGVGGVGSVGGAGSVGGGVLPPQISPQQLAVLSNIYPHVQQFHLVRDYIVN